MFSKELPDNKTKQNVFICFPVASTVAKLVVWTFQTKRFISKMYLAQDCHLQWPLALHQEGKKGQNKSEKKKRVSTQSSRCLACWLHWWANKTHQSFGPFLKMIVCLYMRLGAECDTKMPRLIRGWLLSPPPPCRRRGPPSTTPFCILMFKID